MTTAREILTDALTFHLNKLAPGETLNADDAAVCLGALNNAVDIINGEKTSLFRELLSPSAAPISGASATLGTNWTALSPGDLILGASYNDGAQDVQLKPLDMARYHAIPDKTQTGDPEYFIPDGLSTVYLYPVLSTARTITLRTKQAVTEFANLTTDYTMPDGWRSSLAAITAEILAPVMVGGVPASVARTAKRARMRLKAAGITPAIVDACSSSRSNILQGTS